ncbi:hypothetical protein DEO72_LG10g2128 [Vigna unguiculata]|uniref:Uncharacterized protein n=1 Tax=Vigna unguiculata TaxID=3917 RepID=A0A4D6NAY9_VIGUN|nr:hypothetical protein DEO72_LG10g2128 [Vigna unguiculata]
MVQHSMFRLEDEFHTLMECGDESFGLTRSYRYDESSKNTPFDFFDSYLLNCTESGNSAAAEESQVNIHLAINDRLKGLQ